MAGRGRGEPASTRLSVQGQYRLSMADDETGRSAARPASADQENAGGANGYAGAAAQGTAWAFAFLILRIFAVSGYHWDTAYLVSTTLSLNDGLALVFGSLMAGHTLTSVLLIGVLPLLLSSYLWGPREHRPAVFLLSTLGLVTLVALTVSFHSWWLPGGTAAVLGLAALARRLPPQRPLQHVAAVAMARVGWVAGVGVLLLASLVQTPWVPHEQIETTDGTISGYVLSVDSGYLNVLTDDREFVILISGNVLSRQ